MAYLKISDLRGAYFQKAQPLNESSLGFRAPTKRIFLSYKHEDKDKVVPVVKWLQSKGVNVYIDYLDNELIGKSDVDAAKILRTRIQQSDKFILLSTHNVRESKWVPWELGLGDGFDGYKNVIRLPLTTTGTWTSKDFYDIYGYIYKSDLAYEQWYVEYPDSNYSLIKLEDWLKS